MRRTGPDPEDRAGQLHSVRPPTMLDKVRNIGIIAHVDAGKTTTTERILYFSGTKHKVGDVDSGDTTTDFDPLERAKGITINSAAVSVDWGDKMINIIDTPGHVDFTAEVERSLRVLDGAVGVFCAVGGVEVQSETVWFQANKYKVPRLAYVNKMDRTGADFFACIDQMKDKLRVKPCIMTLPIGAYTDFQGVIDLVRMKFILRDPADKKNINFTYIDIPESHKEQAEEYHQHLLDQASMASDEVAELMLEGKPVPEDLLKSAIRKGTIETLFTPIFCGSSKTFHGVQHLMDAVCDFLPSPIDRPPVEGIVPRTKVKEMRAPDPKDPFSGLAFKTVADATAGDLVYVRIYSGELKPGDTVTNTANNRSERIGRIYRMMGNKREELAVAGPGMIVAVIGLKQTYTGNTICDEDKPVSLESINFPKPVISCSLIPDKSTDESKLADALGRLVRDDPTLKAHTDPETNELIISGMGELHLEVSVDKLQRFPGVKVTTGKPMVAYRQTIAKDIVQETKYVKQTGGRGKFAVVVVEYKRLSPEAIEVWQKKMEEEGEKPDINNIYFYDRIFGGSVPKEYIKPTEDGIRRAATKGAKYGFPCVDIEACLVDGKIHAVDSSQDAFQLAGWENFRDAQMTAGIVLLEPIMKVGVVGPDKFMGFITGDISRRRGVIQDSVTNQGRVNITGHIPLAELFGYTTDLRGSTQGTASFTMEFSHYAEVKEELAHLPKKDK